MTIDSPQQATPAAPEPIDNADGKTGGDLDRYGITSHQHVTYEWNGYRYTNSSDAIAAAKRAAR